MSIYKLYGTGVTDNIANLDIVKNGNISSLLFAGYGDLDADGETLAAEVSFSSASGFTTNDTKSSIATVRALAADTGAAASNKLIAINLFVGPNLGIPVKQGERMYLHGTGTALVMSVYLYVNDGPMEGRARRVRL
jgi:hypothetical protein